MIGGLVAAAMAVSFFLPWVNMPGDTISPYSALTGQFGEVPWADMPWQLWAFLASGALAAIVAVRAIAGQRTGGLMLITGLIPFAMVGQAALSADPATRRQVDQMANMPGMNPRDMGQMMEMIQDFVGPGLPIYVLAALLLVLIGLVRLIRGT